MSRHETLRQKPQEKWGERNEKKIRKYTKLETLGFLLNCTQKAVAGKSP